MLLSRPVKQAPQRRCCVPAPQRLGSRPCKPQPAARLSVRASEDRRLPSRPADAPSSSDWRKGVPDYLSADSETETRREKFVGKLAVLILGATLVGERLTGDGFVAAIDHEVGVGFWQAQPFLGLLVLGLVSMAVYPSRSRLLYPGQQRSKIMSGIQRLVGRAACLTLAGTIVLEVETGKGMLKLLNIQTGLEQLSEVEFALTFILILGLTEEFEKETDP